MTDGRLVGGGYPDSWPWPNGKFDLDYAVLNADDVLELDNAALREGLIPRWKEPLREVLNLSECLATDELRSLLSQSAVEAGNARMRATDGVAGAEDRLRVCAHAWHRVRERAVWLDGGGLLIGYNEWIRLGRDCAGASVYSTFCSVWELERYVLSWLMRFCAWCPELAAAERNGVGVWRTAADVRGLGRPGRGARIGIVSSVPARLERVSGEVRFVWKMVEDGDVGAGAIDKQMGAVEAAMHVGRLWVLIQWADRFVMPVGVKVRDMYPEGLRRGGWEATEFRKDWRMRRSVANKLARRLRHPSCQKFLTVQDALDLEASEIDF